MNSYHVVDVFMDTVSYGVSGLVLDKLDVIGSLSAKDYIEYAIVDMIVKNMGLACSVPLTSNVDINNKVYHGLTMTVGKSIADVIAGRGIGTAMLKKNVLAIAGGEVMSTAVSMIRSKF